MLVRFTKMHGLGNDFVLLDLISQKVQLTAEQIRTLGDRRTGVGFDQLLMVEPPRVPEADFRYRIFNSDGTEVEQCGNGARCYVRFVRDRGLTTKTRITLETNTGLIECQLEKDGNITIDMGPPRLLPAQIPFIAENFQIQQRLELCHTLPACQLPSEVLMTPVNVGNPHAVLVVDDVETAPVVQLGKIIESHPRFPERVNVGFMQVVSRDHLKLRVFERGVGETRACGTGACAAVVAGRLQGLIDDHVTVSLPGGDLSLQWPGGESNIKMTGPACRVYEGRLHI